MQQPYRPILAVASLALGVLAFHLMVRPVWLGWDPDIALYLLGAQNIVDGTPYYSTPYIFNPAHAIHPAAYPPGLPLLMAPILKFRGLDIAALNAVIALCFAAFLVVLYFVAKHLVSLWAAVSVAAVVGLNPYFNMLATMPYAELPFLLYASAGMLLLDPSPRRADEQSRNEVARAALGGALIGLAVLIRSVGFLLLPAVALAALFAWARTGRQAALGPAVGIAVAILLYLSVSMTMPHDMGTYVGYASGMSPLDLIAGARRGIRIYAQSISNDYLGLVRLNHGASYAEALLPVIFAVSVLAIALAAIGWLSAIRQRCSSFEAFAAIYATFIVLYPIRFEPARYLLPVVPLLVLYSALGLSRLTSRLPAAAAKSVGIAFIAAIAVSYAATVPNDLSEKEPWPTTQNAQQLFAAIVGQTDADAVILAFEPTTIALFTGRRSAIWPNDADADELLRYAREIGASYIIPRPPGAAFSDLDYDAIAAGRPGHFTAVYENSSYRLIKVLVDRGG